ncbi:Nif3-like dinuclear metal center hexameric protein [Paenibacillus sp. NFR01]|uniref:Nif3-like dinuclear metal center hexameric protein n=1 Tax=Paenibacillus sp. NFR01 TaxID=1566279 RepID=UPI0008D03511|nr:Nif3-like dinuclear metal center hexameric protein [Paenibacillus sp. NFR01]SET40953.1 Putative GTP cyclohydrolase 1 type 2, NIF3 family [Paenibacillus sp. NFR01]
MGITVDEAGEILAAGVPLPEDTVDGLKAGSGEQELKGIAVAFMPTHAVIREAMRLGANLLIVHEGLGYRHRDRPELLRDDPVYLSKMQLINETGIAVYRLHDAVHRCSPDLITAGLVTALGWEERVTATASEYTLAELPGSTLRDIANHVKSCLGLPALRVIGHLPMVCRHIALTVGYRGGADICLPLLRQQDLLIIGESPEWETPEYVRDAVHEGHNKALIVLGHGPSEEPGMKLLAASLPAKLPGYPVHFIPAEPLFQTI